jgi:hypothetical protein
MLVKSAVRLAWLNASAILLSLTGAPSFAADAPATIALDPGTESQLQEFVLSVSDIERALPAFRDVLKWKVLHEGRASSTVARAWGLAPKTPVDEVLLGNAASKYGYVRLVRIQGLPQQAIRPLGRWWDTGGLYNLNVLVRDLDAVESGLERLGWHAVGLPDDYVYPGDVRGRSQIMIGPEYVVLSFQQRISPPLTGWPEFAGATHVEVGYQLVTDFAAANDFWTKIVGLSAREPRERRSGKAVGRNDYGLPHNAQGLDDSRQGGAYPRKGGEQLIGLRQFLNATGYDFSERARPPNLGVMTIRMPFADIDPILERARRANLPLAAEPQIVDLPPYGKVRLAALRAPGSGLWVELVEPGAKPLSKAELQALLARGGKGRWKSFGGGNAGTMSYARGGAARVTWASGAETGTWAVKGDALCTAWKTMRDGREQCARYYALGGRDYQSFQLDGTPDGFSTFD